MFQLREDIEECSSLTQIALLRESLGVRVAAAGAELQAAWEADDRDALAAAAVAMRYLTRGVGALAAREEELQSTGKGEGKGKGVQSHA